MTVDLDMYDIEVNEPAMDTLGSILDAYTMAVRVGRDEEAAQLFNWAKAQAQPAVTVRLRDDV